ncbi:unnamed protein product, partial [Polarella glacialis]
MASVLAVAILLAVPSLGGAQGSFGDLTLHRAHINSLNSSLHAKFFVLRPPPELRKLRGTDIECKYFGHMYSFEFMYSDFFELNSQFTAASAEEADFVVLEHCITYVYHVLRYGAGFNTVKLTWDALRIVQEEYMLPIIRWAQEQPAYQRTQGRNFVIVLAMDKGRVDYPLVSRATQHWHAITTVGNGTTWMKRSRPWMVRDPREYGTEEDACRSSTSTSKRRLIWYDQDVVVPVPTAFSFSAASEQTEDRDLLVFYAGSPNSCIRRQIVKELAGSDDAEVLVIPKPIPRGTWSEMLYRSRFCFVPDGFSSISARLYEVLQHGCVPVLFSHAFHPPFESLLDWRHLAIFLRNSEVASAPAILRTISDERYHEMHRALIRAQRVLSPHEIPFWVAANMELQMRS